MGSMANASSFASRESYIHFHNKAVNIKMADLSGSLSFDDVSKWKVADLKKELKARGLNTVGNKNDLFERLQLAYEEQDMGQGSPLDNEELLDDDEVLEEEESLDEDLSAPEKSSPLALKRKSTPPVAVAVPMKKIVLNRTAVATAEKENLDGSEEGRKPDGTDPTKQDIVKTSLIPISAKERLEMRASKFGVSLSADAKKEVRAARFGITTTVASSTKTTTTTTSSANIDALKRRAERFGASVSSTLTKVELDEKLKKRQERFGLSEAAVPAAASKTKTATTYVRSTSSSSSVKVPITFGGAAAAPAQVNHAEEAKKKRAERFKATL